MKNVKNVTVMLALAAVIAMAMTACPTGGGTTTTATHKCPSLDVHYLTCAEYSCTIGGHTQKAIGSTTVGGCPVYITKGVKPEDAPAAIANINTAISWLGGESTQNAVIAKIKVIKLVPGTDITSVKDASGKYTVSIGFEASDMTISGHFGINIVKGHAPCLLPFLPRIVSATAFC